MTGFICPVATTQGSPQDDQTPSSVNAHSETLLIRKPFLKSKLQNQSIHKNGAKHTCTNIKYTCWRDGQTDRQTQTDRHTDRQTDRDKDLDR